MKKKRITIILASLLIIGLGLLFYPTISQNFNARLQTKSIATYARTSEEEKERSEELLVEAQAYNEELLSLPYPLVQYAKLDGYSDLLSIDTSGIIGIISIEKIQADLPIYHGTSGSVLSQGVGHMQGTSMPIGGSSTHSVLSAHRGLSSSRLFTDLNKLEKGDTFTITVLGRTITYQIDQIKIVEPSDTSDLAIEKDKDYVTLITCTPYGINTHRLLVRGVRVENIKKTVVTAEAFLIDKLIVSAFVATPIIIILVLYVMFKPVNKKKLQKEKK